jgi:hypothetical protein
MRELSDDGSPVVYHDGSVWFFVYDPHTGTTTPTRGVCLTADDDLIYRNEPLPLPLWIYRADTDVPTYKNTGRPAVGLRWATPHDVDPAYRRP